TAINTTALLDRIRQFFCKRLKVKPFKGTKVTPSLLPYTSIGRPASQLPNIAKEGIHILVDYNAKYARDELGKRVSATDMHGCSGGTIIDLGRISADALGRK